MEWMMLPLRRYAEVRGRSRRKEFWLWFLFVIVATIVLSIVDRLLGLGGSTSAGPDPRLGVIGYGARASGGVLTGIFSLAVLVPNFAVAVRRLHDTNRSGWWLLAPILPYVLGFALMLGGLIGGRSGLAGIGGLFLVAGFIAALVLLVFYCLDGTPGPNRFGADPKDPAGADLHDVFR